MICVIRHYMKVNVSLIASYLKYGDAMEAEMECHFGKLLDEGAHFITFKQVGLLLESLHRC